jgi:hypothetical protein
LRLAIINPKALVADSVDWPRDHRMFNTLRRRKCKTVNVFSGKLPG